MIMSPMMQRALHLAKATVNRYEDNREPIDLSTQESLLVCRALLVCTSSVELATGVGNDDPHDPRTDDDQIELFAGDLSHLQHLDAVLKSDRDGIVAAEQSYRASWKARGGVGAFMMLARKWDRLQSRVKAVGWDVFTAIAHDHRREGAIDDVRDLRRYLALVECEMVEQKQIETEGLTKDSTR